MLHLSIFLRVSQATHHLGNNSHLITWDPWNLHRLGGHAHTGPRCAALALLRPPMPSILVHRPKLAPRKLRSQAPHLEPFTPHFFFLSGRWSMHRPCLALLNVAGAFFFAQQLPLPWLRSDVVRHRPSVWPSGLIKQSARIWTAPMQRPSCEASTLVDKGRNDRTLKQLASAVIFSLD